MRSLLVWCIGAGASAAARRSQGACHDDVTFACTARVHDATRVRGTPGRARVGFLRIDDAFLLWRDSAATHARITFAPWKFEAAKRSSVLHAVLPTRCRRLKTRRSFTPFRASSRLLRSLEE